MQALKAGALCIVVRIWFIVYGIMNSIFILYVSPSSSKSKDVADSIKAKIKDLGIKTDLHVIGCDSANINTR